MRDKNLIETFYTVFLRLVPETLSVLLDVPRLVSEFYSNWRSLKPFISLVIQYEDFIYLQIACKNRTSLFLRWVFLIPRFSFFMLEFWIKSKLFFKQKFFNLPLASTNFLWKPFFSLGVIIPEITVFVLGHSDLM